MITLSGNATLLFFLGSLLNGTSTLKEKTFSKDREQRFSIKSWSLLRRSFIQGSKQEVIRAEKRKRLRDIDHLYFHQPKKF